MKKKSLYLIIFGTLIWLLVLANLPRSILNHELNLAYANIITEVGQNQIGKVQFFKPDKPGTISKLERLWIMGFKPPKRPGRPDRPDRPGRPEHPKYPVPEPSTILLIVTGGIAGAGIYLFSKYRNRKK